MSKAIVIGVVSVGGAGAVGVGGYALFGNGFGLGGGSDGTTQPLTNTDDNNTIVSTSPNQGTTVVQSNVTKPNLGTISSTTFQNSSTAGGSQYDEKKETVDEIKTVTGWSCFKDVFADNFSLEVSDDNSGTIEFNSIEFGTPTDNQKSGCLWFQTKKVEFGDNSNKTYTGVLSWAWAFKGENKGLAVFGAAKAETTGKLSTEGVMYLLKKDNDVWSVEKKQKSDTKEISTSASTSSDDCGDIWKKLPQANNTQISGSWDNCYLNWLDESELKSKIATTGATGGKATTDLHLYSWTYNSSESSPKKVYECFGNPHLDWLDHLFDNTSTTFKSKVDTWNGKWSAQMGSS